MNYKFWKRKKNASAKKKSKSREWFDAIIFAVIAATIIRVFLIEAYTIPTPSMERSLMVGDFLFVSKVNYGARVPMTPVAFPFAHHTMPLFGTKAYYDGIQWKYRRLPGFQKIKRNDVVVFNFPEGDTVALEAQNDNYYQMVRRSSREQVHANFTIDARPVDKRENFIKRAVAIAGDTVSMREGLVYVNGVASPMPGTGGNSYLVEFNTADINFKGYRDQGFEIMQVDETTYQFDGTPDLIAELKQSSAVKKVTSLMMSPSEFDISIFPHDPNRPGNIDNFMPIIVPKKGWTVKLDATTMPMYERAIRIYEGNKLEKAGNDWILNGTKADTYTFKMDYYWMMGDNRHHSADSRLWGFVPEDHIVGKAVFIWMSINDRSDSFFKKIRWNRLLKGIN
ncbi:MAG: signal peptidase I [Pedobacter sp.]|nr:MAG: signal peptidase I [Pedobacter sp.]